MRLDEIISPIENPIETRGADDKYRETLVDGVNDIVNYGEKYVQAPKKRKKRMPATDPATNSIINTLWHYQNADAS
jgi:hypothetical protein